MAVALPAAITAGLMYLNGSAWQRIATVAALVVAVLAAGYVGGAILFVDAPTLRQRLRDYLEHDNVLRDVMERSVERTIGMPVYLLLIFAGLLITTAHFKGKHDAREQTMFLVPTTGVPCVVLRSHRDTFVCADLDKVNRAVLPVFRLIPLGEAPQFRLMRLGYLRGPGHNADAT